MTLLPKSSGAWARVLPRGVVVSALAMSAWETGAAQSDLARINEAIQRNRMGTLVVQTSPNAPVKVEQVRHSFWFGAALPNQAFDGKMSPETTERFRKVFLETFNSAVTENALKWPNMEPRRGEVNYAVVEAMLAWTEQNKIPLRGHNIFWGVDKFVPEWLRQLDDAELRRTLEARARDVGRRYRGRFAEYDLNNEMIHGNYYAERLGPKITLEMAQWVKDEDPSAVLYLNDYDITTGRKLAEYVAHIRALLEMGVPIGGIGVQGHLHAETFDRAALRNSLDELAQFNLPVLITEFNLPGQRSRFYERRDLAITPQEEEAKGRDIVDFYRICFAHPSVKGILMWGFWAGANWIPQSSLFQLDWTPTPAAHAYRDLVFKEWWTRWEGKADQNGRCNIPAFYGTHRVTSADRTATVELKKQGQGAMPVTVDLR